MRLDGTIRHGLDFNVGNAGSWTMSVAFGPVIVSGGGGVQSDWNESDTTSMAYIKNKPTIPAAQVQSDWNESDNTSKAYIQNKPTIPTVPTNVSAFTNDAGYLNNSYCPIIEDTRSSVVAAITGVAPFSELVDGQRIILRLNKNMNTGSGTLNLTLSNNTTTGAKTIKARYNSSFATIGLNYPCYQYDSLPLIYNDEEDAWLMLGVERNNTYASMPQSRIDEGTNTGAYTISPQLIHDNAYIVEETYSSGSLTANKFYDFGTVSTALTIPSLDATNDLVSNALNFYALRFIAGADNISITFPTGVEVDDTPTINTGDYVEIMINKYGSNFYASIKVWQAQQ